jgi:pimeloyl-ACP methyl ester carboxylesterase
MAASPKCLERPLLIIGGFGDIGVVTYCVGSRFDSLAADHRIATVALGDCFSMEGCRKKVIDAIEAKFPSADPATTTEVDVIGMSMGGVVARYASLPSRESGKRLRIARLFTISSPLRGSNEADWFPAVHPLIAPLRHGSALIAKINAVEPEYPVFSYVRLGDIAVGASNASEPGQGVWWLSSPVLESAHNGAMFDLRILADIARRLRDEPGFASNPPAPLPVKS